MQNARTDEHVIWISRAEYRFSWQIQTTAAPPTSVSESADQRRRCGVPKGQRVDEATKDRIWELRATGVSDREIGRQLGLP